MDLLLPGTGLLFWQLIGFLALLFLLSKFAWKPMLLALKDRENSIESALLSAQKAKEEMAELKNENEKLLDEARAEREKMIREALAASTKIKDDAKNEASKISSKMVEDAREAIQNEKKAALNEVKNEVAKLSILIAERLLQNNLQNEQAQKDLVQRLMKDMNLKQN